jgi:acyl-CoA thioesterase-1
MRCISVVYYSHMNRMGLILIVSVAVVAVLVVLLRPGHRSMERISGGTIVAFGDSLTFGPEVGGEQNYPAQLSILLKDKGYEGFNIINMGVNGDTTADGLARVNQVIERQPDIVIVVLGGNDFLQSLNTAEARSNLESIMQKLQDAGIMVVLGGMRAIGPQVSSEYKNAFNDMYIELADEYGVPLIPDFLRGVRLNSRYNLADRIHPNADGYRIIAQDNVFPVLKKLLDK